MLYWIFFCFAEVFFFNFNFLANVFNKIPTKIIPAKTIPGIIYLNELGKNSKYLLCGLFSSKNGFLNKIKNLNNLAYF